MKMFTRIDQMNPSKILRNLKLKLDFLHIHTQLEQPEATANRPFSRREIKLDAFAFKAKQDSILYFKALTLKASA